MKRKYLKEKPQSIDEDYMDMDLEIYGMDDNNAEDAVSEFVRDAQQRTKHTMSSNENENEVYYVDDNDKEMDSES